MRGLDMRGEERRVYDYIGEEMRGEKKIGYERRVED